jgi:hypothetical protein
MLISEAPRHYLSFLTTVRMVHKVRNKPSGIDVEVRQDITAVGVSSLRSPTCSVEDMVHT